MESLRKAQQDSSSLFLDIYNGFRNNGTLIVAEIENNGFLYLNGKLLNGLGKDWYDDDNTWVNKSKKKLILSRSVIYRLN